MLAYKAAFLQCRWFLLLRHSLFDLGVGNLFVDGSRLHFLQRTHDAILLTPICQNKGVHPVGVEHDVVGCHKQHPAYRALTTTQKMGGTGEVQRDPLKLLISERDISNSAKANQNHLSHITNWRPNPSEATNVLNQVEVINWQCWALQCFHLVLGSESAVVQYHGSVCVRVDGERVGHTRTHWWSSWV